MAVEERAEREAMDGASSLRARDISTSVATLTQAGPYSAHHSITSPFLNRQSL